jgi:hypothetical protein
MLNTAVAAATIGGDGGAPPLLQSAAAACYKPDIDAARRPPLVVCLASNGTEVVLRMADGGATGMVDAGDVSHHSHSTRGSG